jgi:glycosyltransferase involved in cell wall biosynthesis
VKLLHLVPAYFPEGAGGIQNYVRRLVRGQRALGHEVAVLTGQPDGRPQVELERDEFEGVPVWRLYRNDPFLEHYSRGVHPVARERILALVQDEGFDLLHLHSWIRLSGDLVSAARDRGTPSLVTLHDYLVSCARCYRHHANGQACTLPFAAENCVPCAPRFGHEDDALVARGLELFARTLQEELSAAERVLVSTAGMRERLAEWTAWDASRCDVLPLPEEVDLAPAPVPAEGPPWKLVTWGRQSWHKGTGLLLDALRALGSDARQFELEILGPCEPEDFAEDLRSRAEGLPVRFTGAFELDQLARTTAHLAVFTTACLETHGLVLDEARALGWPALVPDAGALSDRAGAGEAAYRHDDPQALAKCLKRWSAEAGWRRQLTSAARSGAPSDASWTRHLRELDRLLESAREDRAAAICRPSEGDADWRQLRADLDGSAPF